MDALYSTMVFGSQTYVVLWSLLIYSVLGLLIETVFCLVVDGVLESRSGLLYLPLRPMYGVAGTVCELLLAPVLRYPLLSFVSAMLICTAIEFGASLIMDRMFGAVSWDYTGQRFNLYGRVCLKFSVAWGLLALVTVNVVAPLLAVVVDRWRGRGGEMALTVCIVCTALSATLSLAALARFRARVAELEGNIDARRKLTFEAGRIPFIDQLVPGEVMINTFPRMSLTARFAELTGTHRAWLRLPRPAAQLK